MKSFDELALALEKCFGLVVCGVFRVVAGKE